MSMCARCGAETSQYVNGAPICVKCGESQTARRPVPPKRPPGGKAMERLKPAVAKSTNA
jgi:hypothetical protein